MVADEQPLNRRAFVKSLLLDRGELLVVTGLGAAAWDVAAVGDHPLDFPMWGAMGGASMVGLGLAMAQPSRKVLVLTGDGEMLMGMGSLATIALQRPRNLRIVVLDNECYGETGAQPTHTAAMADLVAIALGCGFPDARTIRSESEIDPLRSDIHESADLLFAVAKIASTKEPFVLPPRDGAYLRHRMRTAILGLKAAAE
jgi:thiamine pyrophosphate-dependent acetolactate synthase large subunit-like protein